MRFFQKFFSVRLSITITMIWLKFIQDCSTNIIYEEDEITGRKWMNISLIIDACSKCQCCYLREKHPIE